MLRRSLLKGLAAAAAYANVQNIAVAAMSASVNVLNVYVHGLFAFVFDHRQNQIIAYPPEVNLAQHSHVYKAGSLTCGSCTNLTDLTLNDEYSLQLGFNTANRFPPPCYDSAAWIDPNNTASRMSIDTTKAHCTILLPQTLSMRPAHRANRIDGSPFFYGKDAQSNHIYPQWIARTMVFTYFNNKPFSPTFQGRKSGLIWSPSFVGDDLHIFAEPTDRMAAGQEQLANDAFGKLLDMIGNPIVGLTPFHFGDFGNEDPYEPCEEKSLGELQCLSAESHSASGAGEVANCIGLFINPQP